MQWSLQDDIDEKKELAAKYPDGSARNKEYKEAAEQLEEQKNRVMRMVNGRYNIGEDTDYTAMREDLDKLNNTFTKVTGNNENGRLDVYEGWDKGVDDLCVYQVDQ